MRSQSPGEEVLSQQVGFIPSATVFDHFGKQIIDVVNAVPKKCHQDSVVALYRAHQSSSSFAVNKSLASLGRFFPSPAHCDAAM